MIKLSVVLAVFNEEKHLRNCLESIKDLAWEIVVVDGGSKDKTLDIAGQFKAKIIQTDNPINFHINKNIAIDTASGDWVLQLDADEVASRELVKEIKKEIASKSEICGYWIPRKNFFLGKFLSKGGQYPDYTLRLYKKDKGRLPGKDVHEQAVVSGKVGYLKNDLLHNKDNKFSDYMIRFNRYTDLYSNQLREQNITLNVLSFINFIIIKPVFWFLKSYLRHKGLVDGFPGFVFALFSSLRFPVAYFKFLINHENSN